MQSSVSLRKIAYDLRTTILCISNIYFEMHIPLWNQPCDMIIWTLNYTSTHNTLKTKMHKLIDNAILQLRGFNFIVYALDIELPYSKNDTLRLVDAIVI